MFQKQKYKLIESGVGMATLALIVIKLQEEYNNFTSTLLLEYHAFIKKYLHFTVL